MCRKCSDLYDQAIEVNWKYCDRSPQSHRSENKGIQKGNLLIFFYQLLVKFLHFGNAPGNDSKSCEPTALLLPGVLGRLMT